MPSTAAKLLPQKNKSYRLVTRSDMDGLVCSVLLKELGIIDDIMFAHPKDMQDGLIDVDGNDISANLPYHPDVYLAFDHHTSEITRVGANADNHVIDGDAPSASRVVYDYFGGAKAFPRVSYDMMEAVDKVDSASLTRDDILDPKGWVLLGMLMDARTGLGRFRDFNISNYQLMMQLIDHCRDHDEIDTILELPDVKERVDLFMEHKERHKQQLLDCTRMEGDLAIVDLRREQEIWAGNRFVVYALFPQSNISAHIMWGKNRQNTVIAVGKSILNRTSKAHVGNLMLEYGGGGHAAAGTCQVDNLKADEAIKKIVEQILKENG